MKESGRLHFVVYSDVDVFGKNISGFFAAGFYIPISRIQLHLEKRATASFSRSVHTFLPPVLRKHFSDFMNASRCGSECSVEFMESRGLLTLGFGLGAGAVRQGRFSGG